MNWTVISPLTTTNYPLLLVSPRTRNRTSTLSFSLPPQQQPLPQPKCVALPRRRYRVCRIRSSYSSYSSAHKPKPKPKVSGSASAAAAHNASSPSDIDIDIDMNNFFGRRKELSKAQSVVQSLSTPPPLRIAGSLVFLAASVAAGYALASRTHRHWVPFASAAALGAVAGSAVYLLNSRVPEVAAATLHNYAADVEDPRAVNREVVQAVADRYGVSREDPVFKAEVCALYCRFIYSVIPPANEDLKGNEVEAIINFKNALGIDDPDAANMHLELARLCYRRRLETQDPDEKAERSQSLKKIIYVSTLVFGEASKFLLPWTRLFSMTDAQVQVAIRDCSQRLYAQRLRSIHLGVGAKELVDLREAQRSYHLSDELAEEMFKDCTRKLVGENILRALSSLKNRTRGGGTTEVVEELDKILAFNDRLVSLRNHPNADSFARGIGPISLAGGEDDTDRRVDDLKLLYRAYVTDSLSGGRIEENKIAAFNQLKNVFGLGKREAETIMLEVTAKVYRKLLGRAVSSGDLEAADSKAAFLQNLCDQLRFDPLKAAEVHEEIYRQKLQQCLDDGELSEEDVKALLRVRVMLCVPQKTVESAHADVCGNVFEKVVKDAISCGVEGFNSDARASVRKAAHHLRLTREAAISIAGKVVRRAFVNYVKSARAAGSRSQSADILKNMIHFNNDVVTKLVADIKGDSTDTTEEPVEKKEKLQEEEDEWSSLETLRKTKPDYDTAKSLKRGQTEITLKDDLPERDRVGMYKTYLLYLMTGEDKKVAFGLNIPVGKDKAEFLNLHELGGIFGLSRKAIVGVHKSLAEEAFRKQAEVVLADKQVTKGRIQQLDDLLKEVGLPAEYGQKVKESIINSKLASTFEAAMGQGRLNIKQIREVTESGGKIENMLSESLREKLFKKTVDELFSSGTGDFDEHEVYSKIPEDLHINAEKAKQVVHELAQSRLSSSLVQAVALLRQRKRREVVSSLNNLLACDKAVSAEPLSWDVPEELADLFGIYMKSEPAAEKLSRLQYLLGISDSTATAVREMVERSSGMSIEAEAEAEEFVF